MHDTNRIGLCAGLLALATCAALGCGGEKSSHDMHAMNDMDAGMQAVHDSGKPHDTVVHMPHGPVTSVHQSDAGTPTSAGFGVEPPRGPRSTARIRALVVEPREHNPIGGAAVSAGGKAFDTGVNGLCLIDEVYGKDSAHVLVRAMGFTEGRARVPIRAGETSVVVIMLEPTGSTEIEDLAAGGKVQAVEYLLEPDAGADAGIIEVPTLALTLPPDALVAPWGASASGGGTLTLALLDEFAQAAVVPGGTLARAADGTLMPLQLRALFEMRVVQGGTPFALTKPASLSVPLQPAAAVAPLGPAPDGGAAESDRLYWYNPREAAFVAGDPITEQDGVAQGQVDRFGFWAIGRPAAAPGCAHGQVQDAANASAQALPFAVLRVTDSTQSSSQLIWAGADGSYCFAAGAGGSVSVYGLANSATSGLMRIDIADSGQIAAATDTPAAACAGDGSTCAQHGPLLAEPFGLRCVQGSLEPFTLSVGWSATTAMEVSTSGALEAGQPFCVEVPGDSSFAVTSSTGACGTAQTIAGGPTTLCGEDDCIDVGAIKCCDTQDLCNNQNDDDCDGMTDEGCTCGTTACPAGSNLCCTAEDACGLHTTLTGACLTPDFSFVPIGTCPSEMVDGIPVTACCRSDMRCGLMDSSFGCVAREDATEVLPLTASLAPISCTL